jgi:riboflavin biosynthesis pyrimidine reductase
LGNRDDHAVFGALREQADVVLVGLGTVVSEHYHAPETADLRIFVIADKPDISGASELFASGSATLVLPEDAGGVPEGVPSLQAGMNGQVDLTRVIALLAGKVALLEGGPMLAGAMVSQGLVDEFFLTVAPRVIAGDSGRVVHGPDADPTPWELLHGFVDEQGFLFLRYGRPSGATT